MVRVRASELYLDVAHMLATAAAHTANEGRKREKTRRMFLSPAERIRALVRRARTAGAVYALTEMARVCEALAAREERELVLDDVTPVYEARAEDLAFDDTTEPGAAVG